MSSYSFDRISGRPKPVTRGARVIAEERRVLLKAKEAADYLRVSLFTLNRIEREGRLAPFRTPGGHRRYSLAMLNQYLEATVSQGRTINHTERR